MKRTILLAFAAAALLLSAGCSTTSPQTPAEIAANLSKQVAKTCAVVQPTIASLQARSAQLTVEQVEDLAKASDLATKVCTEPALPAPTSIANLIQSAFPVLIQIVNAAPLLPSDKATVSVALTAAQVALSVALTQ